MIYAHSMRLKPYFYPPNDVSMKKLLLLFCLFSFSLAVSASTGVEPYGEVIFIKVARFYPNPASSVINFEFKSADKNYSLQIYNFLGKKLYSQAITNTKLTIPLETFFRGLYVYQLRDAAGNIVESGKFQVVR